MRTNVSFAPGSTLARVEPPPCILMCGLAWMHAVADKQNGTSLLDFTGHEKNLKPPNLGKQGAIVFSGTEAGRDNAGLPGNAYFSPVNPAPCTLKPKP